MNGYVVAVNTPFNNSLLTYLGPEGLEPGTLVEVPLGKRNVLGCVLEGCTLGDDLKVVKEIKRELYPFRLSESYISFLRWTANYYHYPLGQLISDTIPNLMKRPRELKAIYQEGERPIPLNKQQQSCFEGIRDSFGKYKKWLLHGVTGSGKSNVYMALIKEVIKAGNSVLFLLPEINLTPQFIKMFKDSVDAEIYLYNSSISKSDKFGLWSHLATNKTPCVVIGVRSAVFLPIKDLGLIIVDEEHDQSFKQDDRCPYNARDLAIKRASDEAIPIVLGSATPSLETYVDARESNNYLTLTEMALSAERPEIELVDLRLKNEAFDKELWPFKKETIEAIGNALEKKEQVLVFMNKLGFADFLQCRSCGHEFHCPNCSSNLKFYKKRNSIECQICAYEDKAPEICPKCGNMNLKQIGFGTEKLTEVLSGQFPNYRVERFDRDELTTASKTHERLEQFHRGEIDVFVGTQMLAKGHNFKRVNLVVVMGVDSLLNFPDFRASERAYQLLTQVAGRPGRYGEESKVYVQTLNTDHPLFGIVKRHEFDEYYQTEIQLRKLCGAPPFSRVAMIYIMGKNQGEVIDGAHKIRQFLDNLKKTHFSDIEALGPRPGIIEKRVNKYTWAIMVKSTDRAQLHNLLKTLGKNKLLHGRLGLKVDIDPYHLN